jgi:hypothetical protein
MKIKHHITRYRKEDLIGFAIGITIYSAYVYFSDGKWDLNNWLNIFFFGGPTGALAIGFIYRHFTHKQ